MMDGRERATSTARLADFAVTLTAGSMPGEVRGMARDCLADAVGCAVFGMRFDWSRIVAEASFLPAGHAMPPGTDIATSADKAALIAGVAAHAFELDSLRKPGAGVHPGATVALPALMVAQETDADGRAVIDAIVAGVEVMFRIGKATLHSAEGRGFHAPGITGVFGAAVAAGRLLGLNAAQMENALGLSASMSGGLVAFAGNGTGGMVKRLHLGRASESGIIAARLAARGYEAPLDVLETKYGVLESFCAESDPELLTRGLGQEWEIMTTCFKRYACHVTAQAPVERMREWVGAGLSAEDIAGITVTAPSKICRVHANAAPGDMALAQYSLPFMLAFAAFHEVEDPSVLSDETIADPRIHALAARVRMVEDPARKGWAVAIEATKRDGTVLRCEADSFVGQPGAPRPAEISRQRFLRLTGQGGAPLYDQLMQVERLTSLRDLPMNSTD